MLTRDPRVLPKEAIDEAKKRRSGFWAFLGFWCNFGRKNVNKIYRNYGLMWIVTKSEYQSYLIPDSSMIFTEMSFTIRNRDVLLELCCF